jgi:hypothetical protein
LAEWLRCGFAIGFIILLGFSAGAVMAVALFDILPEVFALYGGSSYMPFAAVGFLAFFRLALHGAPSLA